jgi:hypothetical protein
LDHLGQLAADVSGKACLNGPECQQMQQYDHAQTPWLTLGAGLQIGGARHAWGVAVLGKRCVKLRILRDKKAHFDRWCK